MSRSRNPISAIFSMTLVGALLSAIVRFAYLAYIIVQTGESLNAVPVKQLLIDAMELHMFALYGAGGGAILGIIFVLVDWFRGGARSEDYTSTNRPEINPFMKDDVKARRMEIGDRYLKDHPPDGRGDDTK